MLYYHLYIRYVDKKGKPRKGFVWGFPEELIRQQIVTPYMENKPFLFMGGVVQPSSVDEIEIFGSKQRLGKKIILPNGESALEAEGSYTLDCLRRGFVKDVEMVTPFFITSPPTEEERPKKIPTRPLGGKEKVFIVHGRDEKQALQLQKYLTKKLKIDAEMFEDFKETSGSNTIIEQLEYIKDNVSYAFVIVTPDDLGCLRENIDKCKTTMLIGKRNITVKSVCDILDNLHTRARQNVVFEHGLFIGALGRDRVCCLLQEDTKEKPSDIDGILYVGFDKSVKETFPEITEKLKASLIKT